MLNSKKNKLNIDRSMKNAVTIFAYIVIAVSCTLVNHCDASDQKQQTAKVIANCIRNPACKTQFIMAHRSNGFGKPENSREAVQQAVMAGIPIIEIDIRISQDKKWFVLHDATLDRTTTLRGNINEKNSSELSNALLVNGETLPHFEDMYAITQKHAILFLDTKDNIISDVAKWIAHNGSFNDIIFFPDSVEEMISAVQSKIRYPDMIIAPRIDSNMPPWILQTLINIFCVLKILPPILHIDPEENMIDLLKNNKIKTLAHVLGKEGEWCNQYHDQSIRPPIASIVQKMDIIETDFPFCWR